MNIQDSTSFQPRILVVDNDPDYRQLYRHLLPRWGFVAIEAQGYGDGLIVDAIEKAHGFRCHLALVDMRLQFGDAVEDFSGLDLVPLLKPTESIIVSAWGDHKTARRSILEKGALSFVGKEEGVERWQEEVESAAARFCFSRRGMQIGPQKIIDQVVSLLLADVPGAPVDEVQDLLARLFPAANYLEVEGLDSPDHLEHTSSPVTLSAVPRPNSVILKVREDGRQPVIAKLARAKRIEQEVAKYGDHIQGQLVGHYSPILTHHAILWDLGGAVYTLLGTHKITTFSKHYANAPFEAIHTSLERFFGGVWENLYREKRATQRVSLFKAYCDVWERKWYYQKVRAIPPFDPAEGMGQEAWERLQVVDPVRWLVERAGEDEAAPAYPFVGEVMFGITHGDIHGDNLLIDDQGNAWVVDFERSGWGPILQDFIELEADIINRLTCVDDNFQLFYALCVSVARQDELCCFENPSQDMPIQLLKPLQVISSLRRLARDQTSIVDARQYLLGLLFNTLFRASLMRSENEVKCRQRALMLASILCHRLDHWGQAWPPAHWPPLPSARENKGNPRQAMPI